MNKKFLWLSVLFGGLLFAVNLFIGAGLTYATGNPSFDMLVIGFTTFFLLYVLVSMTKTFGAITIASTLYCISAVPVVLMGPPGIYKILIGIVGGLVFDAILYFFKYRFLVFLIGIIGYIVTSMAGVYLAYGLLDFDQFEKFRSYIVIVTCVYIVSALVSTWLVRIVWEKRISKLSLVKQFIKL